MVCKETHGQATATSQTAPNAIMHNDSKIHLHKKHLQSLKKLWKWAFMTCVPEDSKGHPQNEHPVAEQQAELESGRRGETRQKLPLSLPSPLLVLTNEPLASPNYLARAIASSLSSKPIHQPNTGKSPAESSMKAAGLHIISTNDISINEWQAASSFTTFVYTLTTHGQGKEPICLNHSLQSLKANYHPLGFI